MSGDNSVQSTRRRVERVLNPTRGDDSIAKYKPTEEDEAAAVRAITWVREELAAQPRLDDYQNNLVVATAADNFNEKHLGLVVSVPSAYARAMDQKRELARKATTSHHVGVLKERVDFELTLRKCRTNPSDFGVSTLCEFEDEAGNIIKWWKSGPNAPCALDEKILLKGTIVGHGAYKGVPETTINRCKPITAIKVRPTVVAASVPPPADPEGASLALGRALPPPAIPDAPAGTPVLAAPSTDGPEMT